MLSLRKYDLGDTVQVRFWIPKFGRIATRMPRMSFCRKSVRKSARSFYNEYTKGKGCDDRHRAALLSRNVSISRTGGLKSSMSEQVREARHCPTRH